MSVGLLKCGWQESVRVAVLKSIAKVNSVTAGAAERSEESNNQWSCRPPQNFGNIPDVRSCTGARAVAKKRREEAHNA